MKGFDKFLELVGVRYGNPNAVFAGERLTARQPVRVILRGKDQIVDAMATGKKDKRGQHVMVHRDSRGRKWRVITKARNVLVAW